MDLNISTALRSFTQRYIDLWQQQTGHLPASKELYGVPSPCIVETGRGSGILATSGVSARSDVDQYWTGVGDSATSRYSWFLHSAIRWRYDGRFGKPSFYIAASVEWGWFHPFTGKSDWPLSYAERLKLANVIFSDYLVGNDDGFIM